MQIRSMYKFCSKYGSLRDVLNGLDASKFSEILNSNTTLDIIINFYIPSQN